MMSREDQFEAFIQRVIQRPLPNSQMGRIKTLARELAEGATEGIWDIELRYMYEDTTGEGFKLWLGDELLTAYLQRRWDNNYPNLGLLHTLGYISMPPDTARVRYMTISKPALDLIEEVEPADIFISYRRKESSAFALLVLARLKAADLSAFLDLSIQPGDNWHAQLKGQIQQRDYFVLLIGKETLASPYVRDEIRWALEGDVEILPVWHNGYSYKEGEYDLSPEIHRVLSSTHTIRVLEESALAYNNAIVELLNRFGVTP
jgi:hypothetical protein